MHQTSEYTLIRPLKDGITTLATDSMHRKVVLKLLPFDCLWRGQLHPNVKDRLERLRELPGTQLQGLIGVEVMEKGVVSVTPYVEGNNLRECDEAELGSALAQLPRIVASLHRLGMVHGAISAGNVIVDRKGKAHLIDPSPLLHDDFDVDLAAMSKLGCSFQPAAPDQTATSRAVDSIRYRSLLGAVALVLAAIGVAWIVRLYLGV